MPIRLKPGETKARLSSFDPKAIKRLQNLVSSNYEFCATSHIQGPDIDGAYWAYINVFEEEYDKNAPKIIQLHKEGSL